MLLTKILFESLILTKILKFHNLLYFIARARQPRAVLLEINGPFSIEIGNLESTSMWQMMCLASCCKNLGKFFSKDSFLETAAAWYCSHDQRISYWSIKVFSLSSLPWLFYNTYKITCTVKLRALDLSTIQFWNPLAKGHSA